MHIDDLTRDRHIWMHTIFMTDLDPDITYGVRRVSWVESYYQVVRLHASYQVRKLQPQLLHKLYF
jgi:hypothetical protein